MKTIPIRSRKGLVAELMCDDEDYHYLSQFKIFLIKGYPAFWNENRKRKYVHRSLMGEPPNKEIDHIDQNLLNSQKSNLRIVTHQENAQHQTKPRKNNRSGFRGVSWDKKRSGWMVHIMVNYKSKYIGFSKDLEIANEIAIKARKEHNFLDKVDT